MGLADTIRTLEAHFQADPSLKNGQALAMALAEMISRKNSKRLIFAYFRDLAHVMRGWAAMMSWSKLLVG